LFAASILGNFEKVANSGRSPRNQDVEKLGCFWRYLRLSDFFEELSFEELSREDDEEELSFEELSFEELSFAELSLAPLSDLDLSSFLESLLPPSEDDNPLDFLA
jgi:hypothetical protein